MTRFKVAGAAEAAPLQSRGRQSNSPQRAVENGWRGTADPSRVLVPAAPGQRTARDDKELKGGEAGLREIEKGGMAPALCRWIQFSEAVAQRELHDARLGERGSGVSPEVAERKGELVCRLSRIEADGVGYVEDFPGK